MEGIAPLLLLLACVVLSLPSTSPLHLKLKHRDSVYSPLYPGNLTDEERLSRFYEYTQVRGQSLELSRHATTAQLQPLIRTEYFMYVVQIGIGTPSFMHYLAMDTASNRRVRYRLCNGMSRFMKGGPHEQVVAAFHNYFRPFGLRVMNASMYDVCYFMPRGWFQCFPDNDIPFQEQHRSSGENS